jgi:tetratricopeptide (TPR) repeat protein
VSNREIISKSSAALLLAVFAMSGCTQKAGNTDPAAEEIKAGAKLAQAGNIAGAIAEFDKAIKINPKSSMAYNNRGLMHSKQRDYKGALADYNKAIEIDPNYGGAYTNRGQLIRRSRHGERSQR